MHSTSKYKKCKKVENKNGRAPNLIPTVHDSPSIDTATTTMVHHDHHHDKDEALAVRRTHSGMDGLLIFSGPGYP